LETEIRIPELALQILEGSENLLSTSPRSQNFSSILYIHYTRSSGTGTPETRRS